jgi:beta-phosphoglucomutase-like phosphatase (HAD superfamily)
MVIEDSPNGIEAAKRAGMQCIALTTTYNREKLTEASSIVDSYSQIDMSQF